MIQMTHQLRSQRCQRPTTMTCFSEAIFDVASLPLNEALQLFCVFCDEEQKSHVFARCLAESRQKIVSNKFQQQSNLEFPMILNWINFRHPNWIRGRQKSYKFWWRCCGQLGTVKKFDRISVFFVRIILIYCLTGFFV